MSIERAYGKVTFICDECGEFLETKEGSFLIALEIARDNGWEHTKEGDNHIHHCPQCAEPFEVN